MEYWNDGEGKGQGKNGMMEYWKNGEKIEVFEPNIPTFHFSIIPCN